MKNFVVILLILITAELKAQWVQIEIDTTHINEAVINGYYIPKDIEDCFNELSKPEYGKIKSLLLTISEDGINNNFKSAPDFWHNWYFYEASRLTRYFNDLGIKNEINMQDIILHTFYRKIHDIPIRFKEEIAKYKNIETQENEEYQKKFLLDSINGVYIPKNIKECFMELDKLLPKEDIQKIKGLKNKGETIKFHQGLGTWIRNNWGLWGGSRFQIYMEDRVKDEPDGMSAMVLEFYWEWLNGKNNNWEKFDRNTK